MMTCCSTLLFSLCTLHHTPMVEFTGGGSTWPPTLIVWAVPDRDRWATPSPGTCCQTLPPSHTPVVCPTDPCLGRIREVLVSPLHGWILDVCAFAPVRSALGDYQEHVLQMAELWRSSRRKPTRPRFRRVFYWVSVSWMHQPRPSVPAAQLNWRLFSATQQQFPKRSFKSNIGKFPVVA